MSFEPYKTPESELENKQPIVQYELASRWKRLLGSIIDNIATSLVFFLYLYMYQSDQLNFENPVEPTFQQMVLNTLVVSVIFIVINGYLLHSSGQTIGKWISRTKIVKVDHSKAHGMELILLRYLPQWLIAYVPVVGGFLSLVNVLFIFNGNKQCGHDLIAKTLVVKAR